MKKLIVIIVIAITTMNCQHKKNISGDYVSVCILHMYPEVKLEIMTNGNFEYTFAYNEELVRGKWELVGDTLFLESTQFNLTKNTDLSPVTKNTNYSYNKDAYIIKRKKMYILDSIGIRKTCYLKK